MRLLDDLAYLTRLEAEPRRASPSASTSPRPSTRRSRASRRSPPRRALRSGRDATGDRARAARAARAGARQPHAQRAARRRRGGLDRRPVRARRGRVGAIVGVEDDGPGIPPDELARVFDRFYRGRSTRDQQRGSGLGLTVVRRIVEAAGGERLSRAARAAGRPRVVARLPFARKQSRLATEPRAGARAPRRACCTARRPRSPLAPRSATRSSTRHCPGSRSSGGRRAGRAAGAGPGGARGVTRRSRRTSPNAVGPSAERREGLLDHLDGGRIVAADAASEREGGATDARVSHVDYGVGPCHVSDAREAASGCGQANV